MAVKSLCAQTVPSPPHKATSLLPVCCICGRLRDETGASDDEERWVTERTYRKTHTVTPDDSLFTHTYCPGCFTKLMNRIMRAA